MHNRDYKFDNLKGIMIFLVVMCHFVEQMYASWNDDTLTRFIYYSVYLFHMPVFIFISGYFSKGCHTDEGLKKTLINYLVPYIVFNFAYSLLNSHGNIAGSLLGFTHTQWTLWYLLSLVWWRLLVRPVSFLKYSLMVSILFSLYAGFTDIGYFLSLGRTFAFFPYFLAGYLLSKEGIDNIRKKNRIFPLLGFMFAVIISFLIQYYNVGISALHMAKHYSELPDMTAALVRLVLLITGFICIFGFISIASDKKSIVSNIGKNSAVIFLVHSGIIRILANSYADLFNNGLLCILSAVLFSIIVCLIFGSEPIAKGYRTVMNNIFKALIKSA